MHALSQHTQIDANGTIVNFFSHFANFLGVNELGRGDAEEQEICDGQELREELIICAIPTRFVEGPLKKILPSQAVSGEARNPTYSLHAIR